MDKIENLQKLNAEDYNSAEVCAYLKKNYNKTQLLKEKVKQGKICEEITEKMLHANREYRRMTYLQKKQKAKVAATLFPTLLLPLPEEKKENPKANTYIDLLSAEEQSLIRECKRNRRKGLVPSREMIDAANRYATVCRNEKKKLEKKTVIAPKHHAVTIKKQKNIDLLSAEQQKLSREYDIAKRNKLPITREMKDAKNLYSKVCRQEKKKTAAKELVAVHVTAAQAPIAIFKGFERNGLGLIQAYESDDDDDE
jgi:hypothetical protein